MILQMADAVDVVVAPDIVEILEMQVPLILVILEIHKVMSRIQQMTMSNQTVNLVETMVMVSDMEPMEAPGVNDTDCYSSQYWV